MSISSRVHGRATPNIKLFKDALDQVELADRLGYDYVWATEHHFLEEYAHSSAPEIFLAAASQRTKNIRLGHGIVQLPPLINHPARVAERIATLDLVSDGRCDFGTGEGAAEIELGRLQHRAGRKARDVAGRLARRDTDAGRGALRWSRRKISQGSQCATWCPSRCSARILRYGSRARDAKPSCSRRSSASARLTFSFVSPDEARQWVNDYYTTLENECEPVGYAVNPNIAIACPFLCDRDEDKVRALAAEHQGFFIYGLGHYGFFGNHEPGKTNLWENFKNKPKDFALPEGRTADCVGTPAQIGARLAGIRGFRHRPGDPPVASRPHPA